MATILLAVAIAAGIDISWWWLIFTVIVDFKS